MRVLFLNRNQPCYVAEPLFHGLRLVLGKNCVDVPRYDSLYKNNSDDYSTTLRGKGFSIYGLLDDIPELDKDRYFWLGKLDEYDFIVIASIWDMGDVYLKLRSLIPAEKLVLIDGYDQSALFPYAARFINSPWQWLAAFRKNAYFKREYVSPLEAYGLGRVVPFALHNLVRKTLPKPKKLHPIAFSIPEEKITEIPWGEKVKDFPCHIVDKEIADSENNTFYSGVASDSYCFDKEEEYYSDLKQSRWGITTRRAGWDCLRHYELAANGCVLCFRDLNEKPFETAPYGLNKENSISYKSLNDLHSQIDKLNESECRELQKRSYKWIRQQTTKYRATQFLKKLQDKI